MNCTELPRPPGVIVFVIGDNKAKANVTVSNGGAMSPEGQPGPLLRGPTPRQVFFFSNVAVTFCQCLSCLRLEASYRHGIKAKI